MVATMNDEINQYRLEAIDRYCIKKPIESLENFDEYCLYLEALLNGPFSILEINGVDTFLYIKATVAKYAGMTIQIHPNEHNPPHFHVKTQKWEASFKISDCSLLNGNPSTMDHSKIRYWHSNSKEELIKRWNDLRPTNCVVGEYVDKT